MSDGCLTLGNIPWRILHRASPCSRSGRRCNCRNGNFLSVRPTHATQAECSCRCTHWGTCQKRLQSRDETGGRTLFSARWQLTLQRISHLWVLTLKKNLKSPWQLLSSLFENRTAFSHLLGTVPAYPRSGIIAGYHVSVIKNKNKKPQGVLDPSGHVGPTLCSSLTQTRFDETQQWPWHVRCVCISYSRPIWHRKMVRLYLARPELCENLNPLCKTELILMQDNLI